jgi:hypothetical protein
MNEQEQLEQQFEDLRNLALVCFLNDLGIVAFLERDERGMAPLFHAAGFITPGTNLIDNARCERVMAKIYQIHVHARDRMIFADWLKRHVFPTPGGIQ